MSEETQANFESAAYAEMLGEISLHYDLMEGTKAMRAKGYLKKFPIEDAKSFADRKSQAVLFNKYEKCVIANVGLILKREPKLIADEQTDQTFFETFSAHWENIDNAGTHGTQFVGEFFEAMFAGHAFIVVDSPQSKGADASEAQQNGFRPYWQIYKANQAINWRTANIGGKTVLTQIVFKKLTTEAVGEFGEKQILEYKGYRLIDSGVSWAVFRHDENDQSKPLHIYSKGIIEGMKRLPVAVGYGRKKGIAESSPPLKDLAYQNVRHFNKESDYDKADAYAGLVFPVAIGDTDMEGLGADLLIKCAVGADFQLRETTGQALEAKRALLDRIEMQMDSLGLGLLIDRSQSALTATQALIDNTQKSSELSRIAFSGQDAIEVAIEIHADFMDVEAEKTCTIDLGFKAEQLVLSAQIAQMLLNAAEAGRLSTFDFLSTLKLGGVMPDSFDLDEAVKRVLNEQKGGEIPPAQ